MEILLELSLTINKFSLAGTSFKVGSGKCLVAGMAVKSEGRGSR
jgi:hypothetical protein